MFYAIRYSCNGRNRELIRWLFHGLDADNCGEGDAYRYEDADERVLFFTINRSGVIGNRKSINRNHIHRLLDDNRCSDNSVHLLEVTKNLGPNRA